MKSCKDGTFNQNYQTEKRNNFLIFNEFFENISSHPVAFIRRIKVTNFLKFLHNIEERKDKYKKESDNTFMYYRNH